MEVDEASKKRAMVVQFWGLKKKVKAVITDKGVSN